MIVYFIIGLIWTAWLEWFTVKQMEMPEMTFRERFFMVLFWPLHVIIFIRHLF